MSLQRQNGHNANMSQNHEWHFWAMLLESALFVAILAFQLHHMKHSLDGRLML